LHGTAECFDEHPAKLNVEGPEVNTQNRGGLALLGHYQFVDQ
jgi:hypothetical protein